MPLFKKKPKKKGENAQQEEPSEVFVNVLGEQNDVICTIREPWKWVIEKSWSSDNLTLVEKAVSLPTQAGAGNAPASPPSRLRRKKAPAPCTLRIEVKDANGQIVAASHGTSEAFDGLEDKDEMLRTIQRCRCEHLDLSPPSRLINWDVTKDECINVVGKSMPVLSGNKDGDGVAVLKEPMGSRGTGIFFVRTAEEIQEIIEEHRKRANEDPNLLDNLIAAKGRIPSWVLQAEVYPCLLIRERRKFHIRTYVVCVEDDDQDDLVKIYVFNRHEIRIASQSVPDEEGTVRDRSAHITNGGGTKLPESTLLHLEPELANRKLQEKLEVFVAKIFSSHLINDISRRVSLGAQHDQNTGATRKFAVAGLDLMVASDGRIYLLEVNVSPSAPPPETIDATFSEHLTGFMTDLTNLVVGNPSPNFLDAEAIVKKQETR